MNLIDIAKNAPEGATHYSEETTMQYFAYWKDKGQSCFVPHNGQWMRLPGPIQNFDERCKKIPKLKVEYVKVHNSIAIKAVMEGLKNYWSERNGMHSPLTMESTLSEFCKASRRVETIVDDRQEFIDGANEILARNEGIHFSELLVKMFDSGKYKMVGEDE